MGEKKINFWKIIKGIKRQSIRMQQRLIVYWCVVILTLFLVTVLLLSILGVLPGMDFKSTGNVVCPAEKYVVNYDRAD